MPKVNVHDHSDSKLSVLIDKLTPAHIASNAGDNSLLFKKVTLAFFSFNAEDPPKH